MFIEFKLYAEKRRGKIVSLDLDTPEIDGVPGDCACVMNLTKLCVKMRRLIKKHFDECFKQAKLAK